MLEKFTFYAQSLF